MPPGKGARLRWTICALLFAAVVLSYIDRLVLSVLKPTLQMAHKGGKRFAEDSWQYRVLKNWIEGGAAFTPGQEALSRKLPDSACKIFL